MGVIFVLLPLALLFVGIAVAWFVWAVRSGQFDDLETPAVRILFDEPTERGQGRREREEASPGSSVYGPDSVSQASASEKREVVR